MRMPIIVDEVAQPRLTLACRIWICVLAISAPPVPKPKITLHCPLYHRRGDGMIVVVMPRRCPVGAHAATLAATPGDNPCPAASTPPVHLEDRPYDARDTTSGRNPGSTGRNSGSTARGSSGTNSA